MAQRQAALRALTTDAPLIALKLSLLEHHKLNGHFAKLYLHANEPSVLTA
jgi:hypothetical protein